MRGRCREHDAVGAQMAGKHDQDAIERVICFAREQTQPSPRAIQPCRCVAARRSPARPETRREGCLARAQLSIRVLFQLKGFTWFRFRQNT